MNEKRVDQRRFIKPLGWFLVIIVVGAIGPATARAIADYARNSDRVDGFHAVSGGSKAQRAGKIVATDQNGLLPNGVIDRARDAKKLGGIGPNGYTKLCQDGSVEGQALIPADVGSEYTEVRGFSTTYGGPVEPSGNVCHVGEARARHVSTGVYRVDLATVAVEDCTEPIASDTLTAVVTPVDLAGIGITASYRPVCDNRVVLEVMLRDATGAPQDAPFAVVLLDHGGLPIP